MSEKFTLTLPEQMKRDLEGLADETGNSQSAIVRTALQEYMYIRRFRTLRNQFLAQAADQEIYTDEDVFERVS